MNIQTRKNNSIKYAGKEIFEIKPVILGGNPTDLTNKAFLTREEHIKAVNYWNAVIKSIKK
ncbi:hypothetical protein ACQ9LF_05630 [Anaerohalosphaeraceae bacterium U12dextr]